MDGLYRLGAGSHLYAGVGALGAGTQQLSPWDHQLEASSRDLSRGAGGGRAEGGFQTAQGQDEDLQIQ